MRVFLFTVLIITATACGYSERNHPEEYIKVNSEAWHGESALDLEIINTAQHTAYHHVSLHITYFENGRKVGSEGIIHWGVIEPESNSVLKVNIHPPPPPVQPDKLTFTIGALVANDLDRHPSHKPR